MSKTVHLWRPLGANTEYLCTKYNKVAPVQPCVSNVPTSKSEKNPKSGRMTNYDSCRQKGYPCKDIRPIPKSNNGVTLAVLGAGGSLGTFVSLQLKLSPLIRRINLFDVKDTWGMACDLNHISTRCKVKSFVGAKQIRPALKNVDIALILAGKSWRRGMTSEELFNLNACTVRCMAEATANACPEALIGVITKPINSFVPLVNEVYRQAGCYNPDKVIGMVTQEVMRANSIVATTHYLDASSVHIPVIGGVSESTTVPLLSLGRPYCDFSKDTILTLIELIRRSEHKVIEWSGKCPAVSGGFAAARFALTLVRGMCQEQDAVMSAFVRSNVLPHCKYFANQLLFGPSGVIKNFGIPKLSPEEIALVEQSIPDILVDIRRAEDFMKANQLPCDQEQNTLAPPVNT